MKGKLFGIGVGPGDPELITVKAVNVLKEVAVVCVPQAMPGKPSLALKIAQDYLSEDIEILELVLPMTENQDELERAWQDAGLKILEQLEKGKNVAFLTLGDPSVYSTYSYVSKVIKRMAPYIEIETIPGITSFSLAAARAGVPLVEKDESLIILPVGDRQILLDSLIGESNVVLMKISRILTLLWMPWKIAREWIMPFSVPLWSKEEKILKNIGNLKGQKIDYMSLIISKNQGRNYNGLLCWCRSWGC